MVEKNQDMLEPIREAACRYPEVIEGSACSQRSYKIGKKAFLYLGMQGGRCKVMFKLAGSIPEAERLAEAAPTNYEVGKHGWVTSRFSADNPLPAEIWERWLEESYTQARPKSKKKATGK